MARIPVEATVSALYQQLRPFGIPVADGGSLLVSTYVDNFYVVAPTQAFAIHALEVKEEELVQQWGLEVKQSSRQVLVATAGGSAPAVGNARWPGVESMAVLGHELSCNGSVIPCWRNALRRHAAFVLQKRGQPAGD